MRRCLITYDPISGGDYSARGLRLLHRSLKSLAPLKYTAAEQRQEARERAGKMSVQGVQAKLSALLRPGKGEFEIVDRDGRYILKPPSLDYPELPENEDLTMRLAALAGIEVPRHGLIRGRDGSLTYFVKRFDRAGRNRRVPQEDFAQITGAGRETKYESSMEKVAAIVNTRCTFPTLEKAKLFERTLFSFLTGNEDMHLKNFSLLKREGQAELTPAYDLVNSTVAMGNAAEEMALPIRGKRSRLTRDDLFTYFGSERLRLHERVLAEIAARFRTAFPVWEETLRASFLSAGQQEAYQNVLTSRRMRMEL